MRRTKKIAAAKPSAVRDESGFIIVAVLWIIAALATLASIYSLYASNTLAGAHISDDRLQAEASIRAGVELAADQILSAAEPNRSSRGQFAAQVGKVRIAVEYRSEGARIDLNAAPKELLTGLFEAVGVEQAAASSYAERIVKWRQPQDPDQPNSEADAYKAAGLAYPPRQAPFTDVLELPLVLGVPRFTVERILPFVTVYNGRGDIDPTSAEPQALAALPGMTPAILHDVLAARTHDPDNGPAILAALGPAQGSASLERRKTFRAEIVASLGLGRRIKAEIVFLLLDDDDDPYRILYWRDDFDAPA